MHVPRPLPRASAIWLGIIGGAAAVTTVVDIWADQGEPDGDTLTEGICVLLSKIPGGRRFILPAVCVGAPAWFYVHIESRFDLRLELIRAITPSTQ